MQSINEIPQVKKSGLVVSKIWSSKLQKYNAKTAQC